VQSRVNGETVRVTLGAYGALAPEQARTEAKKKLSEMAKGVHLNQTERAEKLKGVTLNEAYRAYIKGKNASGENAGNLCKRYAARLF
jgi:hypothetical protein